MTERAEVSGHVMPPRSSLTLITCVLPWSAGARPVPRILPLAASLQLAWPHGLRFRYASSGNHAVACHTFPRPAMTCRVACSAFVSTLRTGGGGRGTVPLAPRGAHLWAPRPTRDRLQPGLLLRARVMTRLGGVAASRVWGLRGPPAPASLSPGSLLDGPRPESLHL